MRLARQFVPKPCHSKLTEAHVVIKAQAKAIVDDFLKDIADAAASGAEVSLPGFGKLKVKATPERAGPQSGKWREDQDCGVKEAYLLVCQIGAIADPFDAQNSNAGSGS